jgi:CheY-like chemotaxis protein
MPCRQVKVAGKRILIIDDDKEFSEELQEMLTLCGYEATALNESAKAVDVARALKPNIILLDLKMKETDGFQVNERLKQFPETEEIPVIVMTGYFTRLEHSRLMDMCGIKACLKKPFNKVDIIARIEEFSR